MRFNFRGFGLLLCFFRGCFAKLRTVLENEREEQEKQSCGKGGGDAEFGFGKCRGREQKDHKRDELREDRDGYRNNDRSDTETKAFSGTFKRKGRSCAQNVFEIPFRPIGEQNFSDTGDSANTASKINRGEIQFFLGKQLHRQEISEHRESNQTDNTADSAHDAKNKNDLGEYSCDFKDS